jgi:hypothetical protein
METGYSLYQNGSASYTDRDFSQLAHSIGSSIQKISKNGTRNNLFPFTQLKEYDFPVTSMQRMVSQLGTHQESSDLKSQM